MKRTREQAAQTKMAIVQAAERQFFQHGFSSTTLEMIASEAGATRGALYWYFADKDELLMELAQRIDLPRFEEIPVYPKITVHEILQSIAAVTVDWSNRLEANVSQQRLLSIVFHLNGTGYEKTYQYLKMVEEDVDRALTAVLESLEKSDALNSGYRSKDVACTLKWIVKGVCWSWLNSDRMFILSEYAAAHLNLMLDSVCSVSIDRREAVRGRNNS